MEEARRCQEFEAGVGLGALPVPAFEKQVTQSVKLTAPRLVGTNRRALPSFQGSSTRTDDKGRLRYWKRRSGQWHQAPSGSGRASRIDRRCPCAKVPEPGGGAGWDSDRTLDGTASSRFVAEAGRYISASGRAARRSVRCWRRWVARVRPSAVGLHRSRRRHSRCGLLDMQTEPPLRQQKTRAIARRVLHRYSEPVRRSFS